MRGRIGKVFFLSFSHSFFYMVLLEVLRQSGKKKTVPLLINVI